MRLVQDLLADWEMQPLLFTHKTGTLLQKIAPENSLKLFCKTQSLFLTFANYKIVAHFQKFVEKTNLNYIFMFEKILFKKYTGFRFHISSISL